MVGDSEKVVAIIPARAGSKGIVNKNVIDINGKPLVAYSIEHALKCPEIDRVIVSTDGEHIAEVAREYGAEVPFMRPKELAEDHVLDWPVFEHALKWLEENEGYRAEYVVHLRPTAPYRKDGWLSSCLNDLVRHPDAHSIRSVSLVNQHPYRVFSIDDEGYLDPVMKHEHPEPYLLRRQDLPDNFYYNCVIDITRRSTIFDLKSMTGSKMLPFIIPQDDVIDLDTPLDLEILNKVFIDKL